MRLQEGADVPRDEVFVTTKVWWENLSRDECLASAERSLHELGTGWVDLLLIHWPAGDQPLEEPLAALQELKERGRSRALGVSNFTPSLLEEALSLAPVLCNQVEYRSRPSPAAPARSTAGRTSTSSTSS